MPKMISWNDRQYFSIQHDAEVVRLSGFDDHHTEFWMVITPGKGYALRREAALLKIQEAIEAGELPGEVK